MSEHKLFSMEVNLTAEEKDMFRHAKAKEWQSWISNEVVKIVDSKQVSKNSFGSEWL